MSTQSSAVAAHTGHNPFLICVKWLSQIAGWASAAMIVSSVVVTCQMIFVRFVLNQSTIWQTEAVIYLMIGATLVGLPYVQFLRGHVNVDLVPLALKPNLRFTFAMVTSILSIVIVGVMVFYGFEYWHLAWSKNWTSDTVWAVRLWIPYLALPVGFGLLFLQLVADMYAVIIGIDRPFSIED